MTNGDDRVRRVEERVSERGVAAPVIEARGLWAEFASGDGVGPVDLDVRAGEQVLVLGPSGSGKSTLLRLLHGAVPHAIVAEVGGSLRTVGQVVAESSVAQLADDVGVVAQDPESGVCLPDVDDEIAFSLENLGRDPATMSDTVAASLDAAGAGFLAGRKTGELSGGELQRVALAAALAPNPSVLLLDEPTSMLDAAGVDAVRDALKRVRAVSGAACLLVEHRLDELAGEAGSRGLPERWIVLDRDGRVVCDARAADLDDATLRALVADGCWLPLDLELRAVFGAAAGTGTGTGAGSGTGTGTGAGAGDLDEALIERVLELGATEASLQQVNSRGRGVIRASDAENRMRNVAQASRTSHTPNIHESPATRIRESSTLTATDLTLERGPRRARIPVLEHVTLELRTGEAVALLGANGTGKSTLLRALAGLSRPDAGRIEGPRAGMVFQNPEHQFAATTVRAELAYGLPDDAATRERVDASLRHFGLEHLAEHSPHRLSGGQKRRVSLAAMFLHDRPFLLADEPTFGLDRHAQITVMRTMRRTAREGRGVCFSSHDLRAVTAYADRVVVLGNRGVLADTTPAALARDAELLDVTGLRPPQLVSRLAAATTDDGTVARALRALDDAALALADGHEAHASGEHSCDHAQAEHTSAFHSPAPREAATV